MEIKGDGCHGIQQDGDNRLGDGISTDQLVSDQAGLVPQTYGRLTVNRFGGANLMVDNFSNFFYIHLVNHISG